MSRRSCLSAWLLFSALYLAACASAPRPSGAPAEYALPPSHALFWERVDGGTGMDWFHLLNTSEHSLRWRLRMIDSAHSSIDMETFLWKVDEGGMRILAHLLAAADRGVRVRILLDDSFTVHSELAMTAVDAHPGIEVRIYNPYQNRVQSMVARTLFNLGDFQRVNHRLHNKTMSVDGWAVTVGGRNLASEYFGLDDDYNFRDLEVLAMGSSVIAVERHFDKFWNSGWSYPVAGLAAVEAGDEELASLRQTLHDALGEVTVNSEAELEVAWEKLANHAVAGSAQFLSDEPAHEDPARGGEEPNQLARFLESRIAGTNEEIVIVTAYLVPTEELAAALDQTVRRGVRVRILTNSLRSNNHISAQAAYQHYITRLLQSGVELYELRADAQDRNLYMRGPVEDKRLGLHAKFILFDNDGVFIGSSNLDPRSLKLNTEVGLMIHSKSLNGRLRDAIAVDFLPRNCWSVQLAESGLVWMSGNERRNSPPADNIFQQMEGWFLGLLPLDSQM